jgi:hypothetical protein
MPETITFPPNVPITLTLADPDPKAEHYDFETQQGRFTASDGRILVLPRQAAIKLNELGVQPGEEIGICKYTSGERGKIAQWAVWLTPKTEQARAAQEKAQALAVETGKATGSAPPPKPAVAPPIEIRNPARKRKTNPDQARLFDKGTGTYGPAPQPVSIPLASNVSRKMAPAPIPWNVAFREVSALVARELATNHLQWSDAAQQDMVSTICIQEAKAGRIGPWERQEPNA